MCEEGETTTEKEAEKDGDYHLRSLKSHINWVKNVQKQEDAEEEREGHRGGGDDGGRGHRRHAEAPVVREVGQGPERAHDQRGPRRLAQRRRVAAVGGGPAVAVGRRRGRERHEGHAVEVEPLLAVAPVAHMI